MVKSEASGGSSGSGGDSGPDDRDVSNATYRKIMQGQNRSRAAGKEKDVESFWTIIPLTAGYNRISSCKVINNSFRRGQDKTGTEQERKKRLWKNIGRFYPSQSGQSLKSEGPHLPKQGEHQQVSWRQGQNRSRAAGKEKIPMNLDNNSMCNIKQQSGVAQLLRLAKIIKWHESSMAVDRSIQEITQLNLPFGGKIMILGVDFKQFQMLVFIYRNRCSRTKLCGYLNK
ncbi:hypothetical protein LXL04_028904 [Taraxacum kok-saghyz]